MSDLQLGLSIDGSRIVVVAASGKSAVSSTFIDEGSIDASIKTALKFCKKKKSSTPLRVALMAAPTIFNKMKITSRTLETRLEFENAIFKAHIAAQDKTYWAPAGAVYNPELLVNDTETSGAGVLAPLDIVNKVYEITDSSSCEVVSMPLVLCGFDGIWLGIHYGSCDITLLQAGHPVAYRQLGISGLSSVITDLSAGGDVLLGKSRLAAVLNNTAGDDDILAVVAVKDFLQTLVKGVLQITEDWKNKQGAVIQDGKILVYGMIENCTLLDDALATIKLQRFMPEEMERSLAHIEHGSKLQALAAFCAASTRDRYSPQALFVNPKVVKNTLAKRRRKRTVIVAGIALLMLIGIFGIFVRPILNGWKTEKAAASELASAQQYFSSRVGVYHQTIDLQDRTFIITTELPLEPFWSSLFTAFYATPPTGTKILQLSVVNTKGITVLTASAELANGTYENLSLWLETLRGLPGVQSAWSRGFSLVTGKATYDISLIVDVATFNESVQTQEVGTIAQATMSTISTTVTTVAP
jgi:hypothetical protein